VRLFNEVQVQAQHCDAPVPPLYNGMFLDVRKFDRAMARIVT